MSTSFLSPPTGWQNILMTRRSRLSTPVWRPPGREALRDMAAEYRAGHVPNALFFDIEALSDHTSPLPHSDAARRGVCRRHARAGRLQR